MPSKTKIAEYYDYTLPFYERFWHKGTRSYALHYGFWDETTHSLGKALLNTNRFLAEKGAIKTDEKVLDAGCGIGGSAIWLAKKVGTTVTGITLSSKQLKEAQQLAKMYGVEKNVQFYQQDFLKTTFSDQSFDVVWAIESVCHAERKIDFLTEAYRLLKKGGRVIVADGFLLRQPNDIYEETLLSQFNEGLALPNLASTKGFQRDLQGIGFTNIQQWDKTKEVLPSAKRLYAMCSLSYPIATLGAKIGMISPLLAKNNWAGIAQYKMVKNGLVGYAVFCAYK